MHFMPLTRKLFATCVLLVAGAADAQSFRATEGNAYVGSSISGGREDRCLWETAIQRNVQVSRDAGADRLTYTMQIERTRRASFSGSRRSEELECDPGTERSTAVVRFYIDADARSETTYSGTVISASPSNHGFKLGDRISGRVEVYDGGRGLDFDNEEFSDGRARVLAQSFRNAVGPEQAYSLPRRPPDITVSCKVVSADGTSTHTGSSSSAQVDGAGRRGANLQATTTGTSSTSCLAYGWEKLRKSVAIWKAEARCDGFACDIGPNIYRWSKGELNRQTGQMRDGCYVYECERASAETRF